jgi:CBS-domain-containing membrane protein
MKHYPFLEHDIKESFDVCAVSDIMSSPVITLKWVEQVHYIEHILATTSYEAFPVLDQETHQYAGLIHRDQLVALLECGISLESLDKEVHTSGRESLRVQALLTRARSEHFHRGALESDADTYTSDRKTAKLLETEHEWLNDNVFRADLRGSVVITAETLPGSNAVARARGAIVDFDANGKIIVKVAAEEKEHHVDVAAAMNRGAYTVTQNCPLSKAYSLFTQMGLRHLPVLGKDGTVVGIVTRSNLNTSYMERRTGLEMHH